MPRYNDFWEKKWVHTEEINKMAYSWLKTENNYLNRTQEEQLLHDLATFQEKYANDSDEAKRKDLEGFEAVLAPLIREERKKLKDTIDKFAYIWMKELNSFKKVCGGSFQDMIKITYNKMTGEYDVHFDYSELSDEKIAESIKHKIKFAYIENEEEKPEPEKAPADWGDRINQAWSKFWTAVWDIVF